MLADLDLNDSSTLFSEIHVDQVIAKLPLLQSLTLYLRSTSAQLFDAIGKLSALTKLDLSSAYHIESDVGTWNLPQLTDLRWRWKAKVNLNAPKLVAACVPSVALTGGLQTCSSLTRLETGADGAFSRL